jgi:CubicO group peptidase (beta-lactamase class C family)
MEINKIVEKDFSGAISIRKNGKQILLKSYGYADIANKRENNIDTKFPTASAGKVFIAAAILQLIEMEKLHFSDTIGNILSFDLKEIDKNITIEQLLNHTSGIPDYFDETTMSDYDELWCDYPNYKIRCSSDLIPLFINKQMMYKPGEKFQYNNTGYVVLGLIIEQIMNCKFDKYLAEHIFMPCKMNNTGYYELDRLPKNCANAYIWDDIANEYYSNIYSVDVKGTGAGGAFTTVKDISLFWDNLFLGKLITNRMLDKMISVQASDDSNYYGYGIWLKRNDNGYYVPWIQGNDPGVSFISSYDKSNCENITIVSNMGNNVWEVERKILSGKMASNGV